jgi:hypothetical protein
MENISECDKVRKFVFGPINSRRLGKSLGIDLVTVKTCSLDCIYCEARATTNLTMTRREYVPVDEVIAELDAVLEKIPVLSNLYLLTVVLLGWIIFRFTNLELGMTLVRSLFGANGNALTSFAASVQLKSNMYLLAVSVFASTPVMKVLRHILEPFCHRRGNLGVYWDVFFYSILPVCLLLLSVACLVGNSYNPFIYFQF